MTGASKSTGTYASPERAHGFKAAQLGLRELVARGRAWSALLLGAPGEVPPVEGESFPLSTRLQVATLIGIPAGILLVLLQAPYAPGHRLVPILLLGGGHVAVSGLVLLATCSARGRAHADQLAVAFVVGHAVMLDLGLRYWSAYPGLTAGQLACLLMGGVVVFQWDARRALLVAAFVGLGFMCVAWRPSYGADGAALVVGSLTLAVAAVIAVASARLLSLLRASLGRRQYELTALSTRLMSVQEEERRRLSRELHDEFGQSLTAAMAYLWLAERHLPRELEKPRQILDDVRRLMTQTLGAMRELSHLLRPSILDNLGLVPSLEAHVDAFGKRHGIEATFEAHGMPDRLPEEVETNVYRIVQEALTNVARHAQAQRAQVRLAAGGGTLVLEVADDGRGLPENQIGIRERVRALGGSMTLTSDRGVRLSVRLPLLGVSRPEVSRPELDRREPAA
jgi:signal transduction histidine kinase